MRLAKNFLFDVRGGKLKINDLEKFTETYKKLEGKSGFLCIQEVFKQRSLEQNKYYWGVVIPTSAEYHGYTHEEMHEAFKFKFLRDLQGSLDLPKIRSTTELSTVEFVEYVEQIKLFEAENGVVIPDPDEVTVYD